MRCLLCENLSLIHICKQCQSTFLQPTLYKRKLNNEVDVYSFYKYEEIKELLHTKHTDIGFYIYKILANNSLKLFSEEFQYQESLVSIGIDDVPKSGYSHTAILNKSLHSSLIQPLYNKLRANNSVSYSGQTKEFRLLHPRDFKLKKFSQKSVILVDDIITTGSTLRQAAQKLAQADKELLLCLTLCDVSQK